MRGEIWTVSGGVYASKPRPALILQSDQFMATGSTVVLPLTTTRVDAPLLRVPVPPTPATGLTAHSWVMIDKITSVRRTALGQRVGALEPARLIEVERLLLCFLGIAE